MGRVNSLAVEPTSQNPESPGLSPSLGSCRSPSKSIEHAELLSSTPLLVDTNFWGWQMSSSQALWMGKVEQNKQHPSAAI